ncbi:hypothetical protein [Ligilactobacillus ruminis]|uniref:hypothetical protein n=1 Tax=Ligilactobacillus ruminis TaxID=1623 RepID=UPI0012D44BD4|nr:hypothetical protein [Ligilactobacillus ruminis]
MEETIILFLTVHNMTVAELAGHYEVGHEELLNALSGRNKNMKSVIRRIARDIEGGKLK